MHISFSLQEARNVHIEGIKKLLAGWLLHSGSSPDEENFSFLYNLVKESIKHGGSRELFFVAVDSEDTIIAIVGYTTEPFPVLRPYVQTKNPIQLSVLMVDKELSGRGIGTQVITEFENWAKRNEYQEVVLTSSDRWKDSWNFYIAVGYKDLGEMENTQNFHTKIFRKDFAQ